MTLSLKGFQGLSAPAKAHPAFVAHAFDLINKCQTKSHYYYYFYFYYHY